MDPDQRRQLAERWVEAWNRRDLDAVLELFADEVVFSSPKASQFVGQGTLYGKSELAAYWKRALEVIRSNFFDLDHVAWDPELREMMIFYTATLNGRASRAAEVWRLAADGRIQRGEALYGVTE